MEAAELNESVSSRNACTGRELTEDDDLQVAAGECEQCVSSHSTSQSVACLPAERQFVIDLWPHLSPHVCERIVSLASACAPPNRKRGAAMTGAPLRCLTCRRQSRMVGLGFVVAKFGLFLRELVTLKQAGADHHTGFSFWAGTLLVMTGVTVLLFASWQHVRVIRRPRRAEPWVIRPSAVGFGLTLILAMFGAALTGYLIASTRTPAQPLSPANGSNL